MAKKKIRRRSDCPVSFALDIFGDKWTLLILRDILFKNKSTYGEFLNSEEKMATNILADRLRMLEEVGIVEKRCAPDNKKQHLYSITEKGLDVIPVIIEIIVWSAQHDPLTAAPAEFVAEAQTNRKRLLRNIRKDLAEQQKTP